jgi:hypothetical protein
LTASYRTGFYDLRPNLRRAAPNSASTPLPASTRLDGSGVTVVTFAVSNVAPPVTGEEKIDPRTCPDPAKEHGEMGVPVQFELVNTTP